MSMSDHHVYVWHKGWQAMPDSRCHFRKYKDDEIITVATCSGISKEREIKDEYGVTVDAENEVSMRMADLVGGVNMDDSIEILQPIEGGTWQRFRVVTIKIEGGLLTLSIQDVNNGG